MISESTGSDCGIKRMGRNRVLAAFGNPDYSIELAGFVWLAYCIFGGGEAQHGRGRRTAL